MSTPEVDQAVKDAELWVAILNSLNKFDEVEVKGVVNGILSPTLPEECLISTYYRATANVTSLLEFKHQGHFQAIGMLARSIFELSVDIALLDVVQAAAIKMRVFLDMEKLRACRSIIDFEKSSTLVTLPSSQTQRDYVANNEPRILRLVASTWPGKKFSDLTHWSGMKLPARVRLLSTDVQELYACYYRQLSWAVHPGLQGSYGLKPESFAHLCGVAYNLAGRNYERILGAVIRALQMARHDPLLEKKMQLARYLPLTESASDEASLRRELGLP